MRARYCGVVAGLFLQTLGAAALAAPSPNNGVTTTVNPNVPVNPSPASQVAPGRAPVAQAQQQARQAPAQLAPAAIAPAALTSDGELEDESGMFAGSESQVLSVVPSQNVAQPEAAQRSWLRQPRDGQGPAMQETKDSGVSLTVVAFLLLGALAGGAVFMRVKRPGAKPWMPAAPVRVLSTTKVGPKASLVTADIYGRVMLLGVTESSVTELGWIDVAGESDSSMGRDLDDDMPMRRTESPESSPAPSRAAFGQVLNNVFGADSRAKEPEFRGNPNVAALIAARETRDVVSTSLGRQSERRNKQVQADSDGGRVETQVAGLLRRRR